MAPENTALVKANLASIIGIEIADACGKNIGDNDSRWSERHPCRPMAVAAV